MLPIAAHAQINPTRSPNEATAYRANPRFDFMVSQAEAHRSQFFNFTQLRRFYAQTRQYDPFGDDAINALIRLSFNAENAQTEDAAARAYAEFRLLVKDHFANLRIVLYALSLARSNNQYGNPALYEWLRDGLIRNLMESGDGSSFNMAYDVLSPTEESVLFLKLNAQPTKTERKSEGFFRYNLHTIVNKKTGYRSQLFVNTTFPVKFIEAQSTDTGYSLNINRQ